MVAMSNFTNKFHLQCSERHKKLFGNGPDLCYNFCWHGISTTTAGHHDGRRVQTPHHRSLERASGGAADEQQAYYHQSWWPWRDWIRKFFINLNFADLQFLNSRLSRCGWELKCSRRMRRRVKVGKKERRWDYFFFIKENFWEEIIWGSSLKYIEKWRILKVDYVLFIIIFLW